MKKVLFSMLVMLLSIALVFPAAVLADAGASIWTDKEDYAPEEVVTISGSGFLADTEVAITVERPDGVVVAVDASTDDAGSFACTYQLDGIGGTYLVTATDGASTATTTFEDAVTISGVYSSNSTGTAKSTFLTTDDVYASVTTSGGSGANNIRLYVLNDVPSNGEKLGTTSKNVLGGYVNAAPDTQPSTFTYMVWHLPTAGTYYIIVDGGNEIYGGGDLTSASFNVTGGAGPADTADVTFDQTGVGSDFTGTVVTVDGTSYNVTALPVTITQNVGLNISFAYSSPLVVDAGKQYVWTNTTGGLTTDQSGNITVTSGGGNVIGNYGTQWYLTLDSDPAGVGTQTGEGWYDEGEDADISTDEFVDIVTGESRYRFDGWTTSNMTEIDDPDAYETSVYMDEAKTVTANYVIQYYLTLDSDPAGVGTQTGEGWYDTDTSANITTDEFVDIVTGESRYRFDGWTTGNMTEIDDPDAYETQVYMDEAKNVTANYVIQYYLTLDSNPAGVGTQTGAGWYDTGTSANISTTSPVVSSPYTYFFAGWTTGDQGEIAEQYALNTTVLMDKAKTVTANYQAMTAGTGGKTLGFWSNRNGQAYIDSSDLTMLCGLNLKNKNESAFDPANYNALKNWLLKADAVNMQYMLSAQLAATELSVYNACSLALS